MKGRETCERADWKRKGVWLDVWRFCGGVLLLSCPMAYFFVFRIVSVRWIVHNDLRNVTFAQRKNKGVLSGVGLSSADRLFFILFARLARARAIRVKVSNMLDRWRVELARVRSIAALTKEDPMRLDTS
jgi:hypothetical protein